MRRLIILVVEIGQVDLLGCLGVGGVAEFLIGSLRRLLVGEKTKNGRAASAHQSTDSSVLDHLILDGLDHRIFLYSDRFQYITKTGSNPVNILSTDAVKDGINIRVLLRS